MVKNEKDTLCTVDGIELEIFIVSRYMPSGQDSQTRNGSEVQRLDLCGTWARFQNFRLNSERSIEKRRVITCVVNIRAMPLAQSAKLNLEGEYMY